MGVSRKKYSQLRSRYEYIITQIPISSLELSKGSTFNIEYMFAPKLPYFTCAELAECWFKGIQRYFSMSPSSLTCAWIGRSLIFNYSTQVLQTISSISSCRLAGNTPITSSWTLVPFVLVNFHSKTFNLYFLRNSCIQEN